MIEARQRVLQDALALRGAAGLPEDDRGLDVGGRGPAAYADAVRLYLAFGLSALTIGTPSVLGRRTVSTWDIYLQGRPSH